METPPHQLEWYDLLFRYDHEFLLSPRDHGKTTVLPRVITEHDCLFTKDFLTLLVSKTVGQSKKSLNVIDNDLTKNKLIQEDFIDELADYDKVGNEIYFNREKISRDATIEGNGLLGNITGGHFFRIVLDDIIDDENSRTKTARENAYNWVKSTILPLLEPGGKIIGIGTRKHYQDAYNEMIKNPMWYVVIQEAIIEYPDDYEIVYDENGIAVDVINITGDYKVLWEEKWDIKKLLLKKTVMGSILFNREYQNDASFMKGTILKDYWLNHYVIHEENINPEAELYQPPPLNTMTLYQGWDLAIRKGEQNDFLVCSTLGKTKDNKIYVLDWYRDKIDFPTQVKKVQIKYDEYMMRGGNVELIGIESNNYQVALKQQVLHERILPIKEVTSINDKPTRIAAGSVNYENGLVYVPIDHPVYNAFLEEYTGFDGTGKGIHDDIVDSMDIAMRLITTYPTVPFKRGMRGTT